MFVVKQRWFPFSMVTASSPSCTNNLLVQFALLGFWGGVGGLADASCAPSYCLAEAWLSEGLPHPRQVLHLSQSPSVHQSILVR